MQEIDILELPKAKKYGKREDNKNLLLWTKFFTNIEELGEVDIHIIVFVTGLTEDEIKKL